MLAWMPAASLYFHDPDGNLLECLSMLPDPPEPLWAWWVGGVGRTATLDGSSAEPLKPSVEYGRLRGSITG